VLDLNSRFPSGDDPVSVVLFLWLSKISALLGPVLLGFFWTELFWLEGAVSPYYSPSPLPCSIAYLPLFMKAVFFMFLKKA